MKTVVILLCGLLVSALCLAAPESELKPETKRELDKMIVEKFDVADMPAREAIGKLSAGLTALSGGKYKIRIVTEPEKLASFKPQILPKRKPKTLLLDHPVTLGITDVPILFLLMYVVSQIDGEIAIRGSEILIYPDRGTFDDLVPPQEFIYRSAGGLSDLMALFEKHDIRIYEGGYVRLSKKSGKITVHTTQSQIDNITMLVD